MSHEYHVGIFTFAEHHDDDDEWERMRQNSKGAWRRQTLAAWLENLDRQPGGAEVVSITEAGDRLTAIVRTNADDDVAPVGGMYEPIR
jgi:hypothetical protein